MVASRRSLGAASALVGLAVLAYLANVVRLWPFTVDDSFITLRYSRNLAHGLGPVFNDTGTRAEGYTSLSWMLLLALVHLLRLDAVTSAKALGVAATCVTTGLVASWARWQSRDDEAPSSVAAAAASAAYLSLVRTAVHSVSGMETAMFALVTTAMLFAAARLVRDPGARSPWALAGLSLLVGLTRPEGNLAVLCAAMVVWLLLPGAVRARLVRAYFFGFGLPLGIYEIARLRYYGLPFPLPFYVKLAGPESLPGAEPVALWLRSALRFGVPLVAFVTRPPRSSLPALAAVVALVVFFLLPEHLMGYDSRYLSPLDPTLSVLFGVGLARVLKQSRGRLGDVARSVLALSLIAVAGGWSLAERPLSIDARLAYARGLSRAHEALGRDLSSLGLPRGRLALSDAGAIPYLSGWWALDLLGLNTTEIAVGGHRDPRWVLGHHPDVIVLVSRRREAFAPSEWNAWEKKVFRAASEEGFTRVSVRQFASDYWLWVLAPRGSRAEQVLGRPR